MTDTKETQYASFQGTASSILTLILYINVITRSNTLTLQKQKENLYPFLFLYFSLFLRVLRFLKHTALFH